MPSSAENSFTQGEYNANARYRSSRHHHGHRHRTRYVRINTIYERNRYVPPTPEVASESTEPFSWKDPIRWWDVDVSTVLKPHDFVNFPPDPAPFKLPSDPPVVDGYRVPDVIPKIPYTFALLLMLSTCHKRILQGLTQVTKRPLWMPSRIWRRRNTLSKLT